MAGTRAICALPLRDTHGAAAGWFNVSVNPIAGRPGYSFWNFQDITARHEMEAVIHDERNKLVDFLDNAPIGFYSVDGSGRFLFVNQTLAQWLGGDQLLDLDSRGLGDGHQGQDSFLELHRVLIVATWAAPRVLRKGQFVTLVSGTVERFSPCFVASGRTC